MAIIQKYEINGLIDTSNNVLKNINELATSAGCFVTWDPSQGHWSVVVNEAGTSVFSFNDSNIISAITVGGTGINDLYNSVVVEFPHRDLRDAIDYLTITVPEIDRYPQEAEKQLTIKLTTINDPVQASLIGTQELKQNRVDKVIQFSSDFTANGLKAGDIVDVTASMYSFAAKPFRIINIEEEDGDDGAIVYSITALEYDSDVYSTGGLEYEYRTKENNIPSKILNQEMAVEDDIDVGSQVGRLLAANAVLGLANSLFDNIINPLTGAINMKFADDNKQEIMNKLRAPGLNTSSSGSGVPGATSVCAGDDAVLSFTFDCGDCLYKDTEFQYEYEVTGVDAADLGEDFATSGSVAVNASGGSLTIPTVANGAGKTMTVTVNGEATEISIVDCSITPLPGTPGGEALPTFCEYVSVPIAWCGQFNGDTGDLEGISVKATALFPVPTSGGTAVPLTCSVTSGGVIQIDSTVEISPNGSGAAHRIFTSFSGASNNMITGSGSTFYGY
jgi:hypothetical protein